MIMAPSVEVNTDAMGLMIRGYDPVAYFTEGRPVPGRSDIPVEYGGAKYLFSSTKNRDAFEADPEKYVPQYGGYCAFGVSEGKKFDIDPASWRIMDGKLYVNLNPVVLEMWSKDTNKYLEKSEKNWPKIRGKAPAEL
jgi:YHS domain-containing protein